jgi:hypothetical protein
MEIIAFVLALVALLLQQQLWVLLSTPFRRGMINCPGG